MILSPKHALILLPSAILSMYTMCSSFVVCCYWHSFSNKVSVASSVAALVLCCFVRDAERKMSGSLLAS